MTEELPPPTLEMEEALSTASSSSSFVPVEQQIQDAIQVINEDKIFNADILDYITNTTPSSIVGNNYHIISVFGSQSTGKSTLLNHLFNTNFDVMDESRRQQTTKGIWMAHSPAVANSYKTKTEGENIFVMDVEGTDGRERGEDQDFERKAALFALSTSEVLIINMWESQIGLYQGANMGLLKTVFEVNLTLFGQAKLKDNTHKVLLLFVIRDHIGVTPKDNLANTVTQDILNMWNSLSKPAELAHLQFQDFFDIAFHTLSHKVLQPDKFLDDVKLLGDRVVHPDDLGYLFKPEYHHNIPIDGWTIYAENCWDQIDNNKDLDLPTQQILVAKFKCDEISASVYEEFLAKFNEQLMTKVPNVETVSDEAIDYEDLGASFVDLKNDVLENYDISASRYNSGVYQKKRVALAEKINLKFKDLFDIYANFLLGSILKRFSTTLALGKKSLPGKSFQQAVGVLSSDIRNEFQRNIKHLSMEDSLDYTSYEKALDKQIVELTAKQQLIELNNVVKKCIKKITTGLNKTITFELGDPNESTWHNIYNKFNDLKAEAIEKFVQTDGGYDFGLGTDESVNKLTMETIQFRSWVAFYDLIHKYVSKDNLINILQDRFDDKYRYDENGLPKLYQNAHELETNFHTAKNYALKVFPILTHATLPSGEEIVPEWDIFDERLKRKYNSGNIVIQDDKTYASDSDSDEESEEKLKFAQILSESDKATVLTKFKREIDAKFVETKRSIILHVTQIPYYIYVVIVVLGWNEFMAVLRNPFFFTLLILMGAGGYVMYQLNLLKPAMTVGQRMVEEALDIGKQKLKDILLDEPEPQQHGHNLRKMAGKSEQSESIEMEDLSVKDSSD